MHNFLTVDEVRLPNSNTGKKRQCVLQCFASLFWLSHRLRGHFVFDCEEMGVGVEGRC